MNDTIKNIIIDGLILLAASTVFAVSTDLVSKLFTNEALAGNAIITSANKSASKMTQLRQEIDKTTAGLAKEQSPEKIEASRQEIEKKEKEYKEHVDSFVSALEKDAEKIELRDLHECTPLMMVCYINYTNHEIIPNADKEEEGDKRETTLEVDRNKLILVKEMVKKGAQINETDKDGWTALCWAAWSGAPSICEYLIEQGSQIDIVDKKGNTPLMMAAMRGNIEVVELLLKKGANKDLKCANGLTALDYIKREYTGISSRSLIADMNYIGLDIIDLKVREKNIERFKKTVELLESAN